MVPLGGKQPARSSVGWMVSSCIFYYSYTLHGTRRENGGSQPHRALTTKYLSSSFLSQLPPKGGNDITKKIHKVVIKLGL